MWLWWRRDGIQPEIKRHYCDAEVHARRWERGWAPVVDYFVTSVSVGGAMWKVDSFSTQRRHSWIVTSKSYKSGHSQGSGEPNCCSCYGLYRKYIEKIFFSFAWIKQCIAWTKIRVINVGLLISLYISPSVCLIRNQFVDLSKFSLVIKNIKLIIRPELEQKNSKIPDKWSLVNSLRYDNFNQRVSACCSRQVYAW